MDWRWGIVALGLLVGACAPQSDAVGTPGADPTEPAVHALPDGPGIPTDVRCEWARTRRVTDGDTIRVDFEGGLTNQPVRYIGIDTPETQAPGVPVQPRGPEAARENAALVAGRRLCLEKDVSERDRYDRFLRHVWLENGTLVNESLVLAGLATVDTFPPDVKYVERFVEAQAVAREAGRGVWAASR